MAMASTQLLAYQGLEVASGGSSGHLSGTGAFYVGNGWEWDDGY